MQNCLYWRRMIQIETSPTKRLKYHKVQSSNFDSCYRFFGSQNIWIENCRILMIGFEFCKLAPFWHQIFFFVFRFSWIFFNETCSRALLFCVTKKAWGSSCVTFVFHTMKGFLVVPFLSEKKRFPSKADVKRVYLLLCYLFSLYLTLHKMFIFPNSTTLE